MNKSALTQHRLQRVLDYEPGTGEFRWRTHEDLHRCAGEIAGCSMRSEYWCVHVDGRSSRAHQLAWLYMTGAWGRSLIVHGDGDPFNNRWRNLRVANCLDSTARRPRRPANPSRCSGITLDRLSGQWIANITEGERFYPLGRFATHEAAHEAYAIAARLIGRP